MIAAVAQTQAVPPVTPVQFNGAQATTVGANDNNVNALTAFEEIMALQGEDQLFNTTASTSNPNEITTLEEANLLNLSPQALETLNGVNVLNTLNVTDTTGTPLTTAQLQEIAGIAAQFANSPLTEATLSQIESALQAAGFVNPQQISLQDMLVAMNYMALSPVYDVADDQAALNDLMASDLLNA